jgi:hypothetical protein
VGVEESEDGVKPLEVSDAIQGAGSAAGVSRKDFLSRQLRQLLTEVERRRRIAGKRYIGSELNDFRNLNYQRYYGPSD